MPISAYATELELLSDEEAMIFRWNLVCLLDLGLKPGNAERLAVARIDHHRVSELLQAGCPLHLIERILL